MGPGGIGRATAIAMAELVPVRMYPVDGFTMHPVVGFVRSIAGSIDDEDAPDICVGAVCPGGADTNTIGEQARAVIGEPCSEIMPPERIAHTVLRSANGSRRPAGRVAGPGSAPVRVEPGGRWAEEVPRL